jgi:hypothetical protein
VIRSPLQPEEVRGLTRSGELGRMLPSEMALLAHGWPRKATTQVVDEATGTVGGQALVLPPFRRCCEPHPGPAPEPYRGGGGLAASWCSPWSRLAHLEWQRAPAGPQVLCQPAASILGLCLAGMQRPARRPRPGKAPSLTELHRR